MLIAMIHSKPRFKPREQRCPKPGRRKRGAKGADESAEISGVSGTIGDRINLPVAGSGLDAERQNLSIPSTLCAIPKNNWTEWSKRCEQRGPWREAILRSLIVLKGLTYAPTGGIVAAPTTSLPEEIGGVRTGIIATAGCADATFTLFALSQGEDITTKRNRGANGCCGPSPARHRRCKYCMA